ncbi:MAG: cell division protein ZapE [Marinicaulis sp.]|nr:cell division protein ZapE [Marinicaulis sp.]
MHAIAHRMSKGPKPRYKELVASNALDDDPAQYKAADRLQYLHDQLTEKANRIARFFGLKSKTPKGLYVWGGVGRGKTLLMDLFFNNTDFTPKRRVHFHEFMAETHDRIDAWRKTDENTKKRHKAFDRNNPDDPMPPVALDIAQDAMLLCFDEFHVNDIADAMILGRLFEALFEQGVVVVATSNRHPDDLYKDGLNRQLFLPFIDLLKERLDLLELQSEKDYRLAKLEGAPVYHSPLGPDTDAAMDEAWKSLICGAHERREEIHVKGRVLTAPRTARGAARFSFAGLCEKPLGGSDYLALVRTFNTLFLDRIPIMGPEHRNEAARFVNLIDAIYDSRTKLVCSADAEPVDLYVSGTGSFEFERTASRLLEMRSAEYLQADHRWLDAPTD